MVVVVAHVAHVALSNTYNVCSQTDCLHIQHVYVIYILCDFYACMFVRNIFHVCAVCSFATTTA